MVEWTKLRNFVPGGFTDVLHAVLPLLEEKNWH
jgi:hypothetical protein